MRPDVAKTIFGQQERENYYASTDDEGREPGDETVSSVGAENPEDATSGAPAPNVGIVDPAAIALPDISDTVLDGRLGEIYTSRLSDFPIAYAWPSLLAGASALIRRQERKTIPANLYVALVGPAHTGKSSAIERANFVLDVKDPILRETKSGSAEGLLAEIGDQQGQSVLLCPDELSHLLEKVQITNASFAYVLNSLFYKERQALTIAHGKTVSFYCRLSVIGGIVEEKFDESFGSATTTGLYDRFLFAQCPSNFEFLWRPLEGAPTITEMFDEVPVDREVWEARDAVVKAEKLNPRLLEISLRAAAICAAIDGRDRLRAADLSPAWELARYQSRVRILLQPNPGKNFEAKIALKILAYLQRHAPDGQWMNVRKMFRNTHAYEYGPSIADRALSAMCFSGAVEVNALASDKGQRQRMVRLVNDAEEDGN